MPNSSGPDDPNFGAIEAAVKETARGRAFLADYARRVRQSDTLTMLALIGRLERWCQDQAVRLAELEGRDPAFGGRAPEGIASPAPSLRGEPVEQMIGRAEASLHESHLDVLAVTVCDRDPASVERTSEDDRLHEITCVRQDRQVLDRQVLDRQVLDRQVMDRQVMVRIEHLANALHDVDRRAADVTGRRELTNVWPSALAASVDAGTGVTVSHSAVPDARERFSTDAADKIHSLEEDVLDGIAKALGTRKMSEDW